MWKFLSRGLRESIEKRVYFTRKDGLNSQDKKSKHRERQCQFVPAVVQHWFCVNKNYKYDGSANDTSDEKKKKRQSCCEDIPLASSWLGALGWSGVLVLGWYASQPSYWKRFFPCNKEKYQFQRFHSDAKYVSLSSILAKVAVAQPADKVLSEREQFRTRVLVEQCNNDSTRKLTPQQEFEEAAQSFQRAQNSLIGNIENKLGVQNMQLGRHRAALGHFRAAIQAGNPAAAFNLGLCHEIGLGVDQDFKQAAKWYRIASNQGHASAMYNLGVFHVHGWGGVEANTDEARELFMAAARLGQSDALRALDMESTSRYSHDRNDVKIPGSRDLIQMTMNKYLGLLEN